MGKANNNKKSFHRKPKGENFKERFGKDESWTTGRNGNSFDWYDSGILVYDSARIPFENVLGTIGSFEYTNNDTPSRVDFANIGGVLKAKFVPSVGISEDAFSTINAAATKVYTYMVSAGSVGASFEANDVIITILAIGACYAFLAEMRRAYALTSFVVPENRLMGAQTLKLLGYDSDNLKANKANFLTFINDYACRLRTLRVPADFTFVKKWFWLNDNIWVDRESPKSQAYVAQFSHYFAYYPTSFASGGAVLLDAYTPATNKKLDDIITFGNNLLGKIINDKDVNDINAYIARAYGENQILIVPDTPKEYTLIPKYDLEVLSEFHNLVTVGVPGSTTGYPVSDNGVTQVIPSDAQSPYLYHRPHSGQISSLLLPSSDNVLDVYTDTPTEKDIMVATRWTTFSKSAGNVQLITACGSEYCTSIEVLYFNTSYHTFEIYDRAIYTHKFVAEDAGDELPRLKDVAMISTFDYAPILYSYIEADEEMLIHSDLQNYTTIAYRTLLNIHNAAITREFGVSNKVSTAQVDK